MMSLHIGIIKREFHFMKAGGREREREIWAGTTKVDHAEGDAHSKHPLQEIKEREENIT